MMNTGPARIVLSKVKGLTIATHHFKDEKALLDHVFMGKFNYLQERAQRLGYVLYNIHFCNAGVGFQWFSEKKFQKVTREPWKGGVGQDYKKGFVTFQYRLTLPAALDAEIDKFESMEDEGGNHG